MVVLSLFDGMSCGQIALERAGIKVDKYYASEIDKYAIQITQKNYPNTKQLGSIEDWKDWDIDQPDLIIGGSPCQGFSFAGKQLNFNDPRSALFFTFIDVMKHYNPSNFLLENVKMKKEYQNIISNYVGVEPIEINSSLVSAQNRKRLYWCNWSIEQPEDKGIYLKDIIESGVVDKNKSFCIDANYFKGGNLKQYFEKHRRQLVFCNSENLNIRDKSKTVRSGGRGSYDRHEWDSVDKDHIRKLTPIECERLQTVPDNYTEGVSNTQRYKMLGNGWTVDVIKHIFESMTK